MGRRPCKEGGSLWRLDTVASLFPAGLLMRLEPSAGSAFPVQPLLVGGVRGWCSETLLEPS